MTMLKKIRIAKNMSQKEIASMIGITQQAYANYENDKRQPDIETIKKLASIFNVTTDYLLCKDDPKPEPPQSPTMKKFIVLARKAANMTEKEHQAFVEFIENSAETFIKLKGIKTDDDKDKK